LKCKYYFEIGHKGNPIPCCEKKRIIDLKLSDCLTCEEARVRRRRLLNEGRNQI